MNASNSLDQVLQLAQALSPADQLRLIAHLAPQLSAALEHPVPTVAGPRVAALSAEDYRLALQRAAQPLAERTSGSVEVVLRDWRGRHAGAPGHADVDSAWVRLAPHLGAVDAGYPTGADNAQIDADLARAYIVMHERGIVEALTTDRRFAQAGYRRLRTGE